MHDATVRKDMILEGVAGIVEGLNPALIRMKLDAYNPSMKPVRAKASNAAFGPLPAGGAEKGRTSIETPITRS